MATATQTETKTLLERADAIAPIVEEDLDEAERERRLTDRTFEVMKDEGLLGVWVPESLGGLESTPREGFELFEAVARIHGSAAWNLWIWSTGAALSSSSSEESIAESYADGPPSAVGAGGIFPFNPAEVVEGGYRVTGRWPFCSGSSHAKWVGGGIMVMENGRPRMTPMGIPEMRFVTFPREEAEIIDTWHVVGLRATSSNDVAVKDAFAPEYRTSAFGAGTVRGKHFEGPLYHFPVMGILGAPIGIIATGIAQRAIDEFIKLAKTKTARTSQARISDNTAIRNEVAKAHAAVQSARSWLYEKVDETWETVLRGDDVGLEQRRDLSLAGTNATRSAAYATDLVHTAAGGTSVFQTSPIERCFRDIHAATQHAGTSPRNFETLGGMLFGELPDNPLLFA